MLLVKVHLVTKELGISRHEKKIENCHQKNFISTANACAYVDQSALSNADDNQSDCFTFKLTRCKQTMFQNSAILHHSLSLDYKSQAFFRINIILTTTFKEERNSEKRDIQSYYTVNKPYC